MGDERVILVTGSSAGLGRQLARHYVAAGSRVIGCSRRPVESCEEGYEHVRLDVSDGPAVKQLCSHVRRFYGRLDVLINNAGTTAASHVLLTPPETMRSILETNVLGVMLFCREAARVMSRRRAGTIINLSSIHVPLATVGTAVYGASKAAVEQFTRVFSKEVGRNGISVNCLGLSFVRGTGMVEQVTEDQMGKVLRALPSDAMLELEDVTRVIDTLISQPGVSLTGQTLYLNGA